MRFHAGKIACKMFQQELNPSEKFERFIDARSEEPRQTVQCVAPSWLFRFHFKPHPEWIKRRRLHRDEAQAFGQKRRAVHTAGSALRMHRMFIFLPTL